MSKGKSYVTDADIAAEIRGVAPGSSWADVRAAAQIVCQRLGSRDDDKTVAAFKEVLDRAETRPSKEDRERAERTFDEELKHIPTADEAKAEEIVDYIQEQADLPNWELIRARITAAPAAVRRDEELVAAARGGAATLRVAAVELRRLSCRSVALACENWASRLAALVEGVGK